MSLIDDLIDHWEEARDRGVQLSVEELCREHPELLPEIRRQIQALEAISLHFGGHGGDDEGADEPTWSPANNFELMNRFEIIKLHASGGLGHVYLAHDKVLDRPVAIKFLKRSDLTQEQLERFEWEAKITGRLEHPGIVPIHSMQESENSIPCYVMRFIDGETLHHAVDRIWGNDKSKAPTSFYLSHGLRNLLRAFVTVCNVVAYAHTRGVIHRDVKPGNIMLGRFGETLLLDWGIAKHVSESANQVDSMPASLQSVKADTDKLRTISSLDSPTFTATGQAIGTPAFASPEQLRGLESATAPSTDIFSLGATLHFILSGKSPIEMFGWSSYLDRCQIDHSELASFLSPRVPKALRAICARAMRITPSERYETAENLAEDIQNFLTQEPVSVLQDPWYTKVVRAARKHPAASGAIVAATLVITFAALISSALLEKKNRDLTTATESLNQSLEKTDVANQQALETLRLMFDDVVVHHFAQQEILSDQDKSYLTKLLGHYEAFANLQGNDLRSRTLQAEAFYRIAKLYFHLGLRDRGGDEFDTLIYCKRALKLYEHLIVTDHQSELLDEYLESLRLTSEIQVDRGHTDDGIFTAKHAVTHDALANNSNTAIDTATKLWLLASLQSNLSAAYSKKPTSADTIHAFTHAELATQNWRQLVEVKPNQPLYVHKLASQLSSLVELGLYPEVNHSLETLLQYANESVQLGEKNMEQEPDFVRGKIGCAWSYHARAKLYLHRNQHQDSLQDIDKAIAQIENVRQRYRSPSFDKNIANYRTLKLRVLTETGKWDSVPDEIALLRPLSMDVAALSSCIHCLNSYVERFPTSLQSKLWLAEMHSRRARLLALESNPKALNDREESIAIVHELKEKEPDVIQHSINLVDALIKTATDQVHLGTQVGAMAYFDRAKCELDKLHELAPEKHQELLDLYLFAKKTQRLKAVSQGAELEDSDELLALALHGYETKQFIVATRLFSEAFAQAPSLLVNPERRDPYNGACCALLAAKGSSVGETPPDETQKSKLRNQALTWLTCELDNWRGLLEDSRQHWRINQVMAHWRHDVDLATIRDKAELAQLSKSERASFEAIWLQVDELISKTSNSLK